MPETVGLDSRAKPEWRVDFASARQYALGRLQNELSPALTYHSLRHTRDEVYPAAERLSGMEGVFGEALLLLRTAALYHDVGFTRQRKDHELVSIQVAYEVLPAWGYQPEQLAVIRGMIMATRLIEPPQTLLEEIIVDADLDVLGRADFLPRNRDLRQESEAYGLAFSDEYWYSQQLGFLNWHRYRTASARRLREAQKQENIVLMQALLAQARASAR